MSTTIRAAGKTAEELRAEANLHEHTASRYLLILGQHEKRAERMRANGDAPTAVMKEAIDSARHWLVYCQNAAILCRLRALELERGAAP